MKLIKMKKTLPGCPDGIHTELYKEGKVYPVNDDLYKAFVIDMSAAEDHIGENPDATAKDLGDMTKEEQKVFYKKLEADERDAVRATFIRKSLGDIL